MAYTIVLTRGGRRNTWGFVVGWVLCACVVAVLTVVVARGVDGQDSSATIATGGWIQLVLGLAALLLLAARRIRARRAGPVPVPEPVAPEATKHEDPKRQGSAGPVGAAVVAALAQGWPVVAAAVGGVLGATTATTGRVLGAALVVAVSASTYLAAQVLSGLYPEATTARLESLRRRIEADRETVIDVVLLVAGGWLVVNGVLAQLAT